MICPILKTVFGEVHKCDDQVRQIFVLRGTECVSNRNPLNKVSVTFSDVCILEGGGASDPSIILVLSE
jgi:hypothetical protein